DRTIRTRKWVSCQALSTTLLFNLHLSGRIRCVCLSPSLSVHGSNTPLLFITVTSPVASWITALHLVLISFSLFFASPGASVLALRVLGWPGLDTSTFPPQLFCPLLPSS